MTKRQKRLLSLLILIPLALLLSACVGESSGGLPGVSVSISPSGGTPQQVTSAAGLLVLLTVLTIAPAILILATSFTRIVIVLSMLRSALGTPTIPPNQVVIGLSLLLTIFIMTPVYNQVDQQAIQPYLANQITQDVAIQRAQVPVKDFMLKQTREKDIQLFLDLSKSPKPQKAEDISLTSLFPAFVISELRTAFTMGFVLYIPFLIIDLVISSVLLAMGMMMLPPSLVSLPFKILLFVLVDGWYLVTSNLALSFMG
jgi:flagellar biosynthetic protein FliP